MRRAILVLALAACAAVPAAAQARPSLVVQAAAAGYHGGFERMDVQFECAAANVGSATAFLRRCSFGPIYAGGCFECFDPPVATGSGNLAVGLPYDLCVEAVTYGPTGTQRVAKCAPYSYLTNTAVIAG